MLIKEALLMKEKMPKLNNELKASSFIISFIEDYVGTLMVSSLWLPQSNLLTEIRLCKLVEIQQNLNMLFILNFGIEKDAFIRFSVFVI